MFAAFQDTDVNEVEELFLKNANAPKVPEEKQVCAETFRLGCISADAYLYLPVFLLLFSCSTESRLVLKVSAGGKYLRSIKTKPESQSLRCQLIVSVFRSTSRFSLRASNWNFGSAGPHGPSGFSKEALSHAHVTHTC